MSENIDRILDECIDRLNSGASVEECLGLYPEHAQQLEPLLRAINELHAESARVPGASAKTRGRQQLLQERARLADERNKPRVSLFRNLFAQPKLWAPIAAVLIVILLGFGLSTVFMTGNDDETTVVEIPTETPQSSPTSIPAVSPKVSPTSSPGISPTASPTPSPDITPMTPVVSPEPTPTAPEPTIIASLGTLEFRVTDAPADLSAVWLTISSIEVHQAGPEVETKWKTVVSGTRTFELLALRGIEDPLGSAKIEAGRYTQIRMEVVSCQVTTIDGQTFEAEVPSGKLKIVGFGSFDIEKDQKTIVTLDIDAEKSVIITGTGEAHFRPAQNIKVLVGGLHPNSGNQEDGPQSDGKKQEGQQEANLNTNSPARKEGPASN